MMWLKTLISRLCAPLKKSKLIKESVSVDALVFVRDDGKITKAHDFMSRKTNTRKPV
jgi:hypothetical protein